MQQKRNQQAEIRLGSHGEDYGSWMSNPVFYIIGGITALAVVLAILSFSVFHITALGVLLSVVTAALAALERQDERREDPSLAASYRSGGRIT